MCLISPFGPAGRVSSLQNLKILPFTSLRSAPAFGRGGHHDWPERGNERIFIYFSSTYFHPVFGTPCVVFKSLVSVPNTCTLSFGTPCVVVKSLVSVPITCTLSFGTPCVVFKSLVSVLITCTLSFGTACVPTNLLSHIHINLRPLSFMRHLKNGSKSQNMTISGTKLLITPSI